MPAKTYVFAARIYRVGIIRYVDVPRSVSKALGHTGKNLPVCGTVEGSPLRTTMVSRGNGCHRLAIHGDIRKALTVDVGAKVEIALQCDDESREPTLPPALVAALRESPDGRAVFKNMTAALRRQIVRNITSVKSGEALERRVWKLVRRLEEMSLEKSKKRAPTSQPRQAK